MTSNLFFLIHPTTPETYELYKEKGFNNDPEDIGIDLYCPKNIPLMHYNFKYSLEINCALYRPILSPCKDNEDLLDHIARPGTIGDFLPWKLSPRSSIAKTPYRVANGYGRMEKKFKGLEDVCQVMFDIVSNSCYTIIDFPQVEKGHKLMQAESPTMQSMTPVLIESADFWEKYISGRENRGGVGSTGK